MAAYSGYSGAPTPPASPEIKVGLGRSNAVVAFCVLGFLCVAVYAGAHGGATASATSARVIGFAVAAGFAVPLVMMLIRLPKLLRRRWVILDRHGLRIQHGRELVGLPWPELYAVGIAYEVKPGEHHKLPTSVDDLKELAGEFVAGRASEALQVSGARKIALEIYPYRFDAVGRFPKLQPYWQQQAPPGPGLPGWRWRFPLPPVIGIGQEVGRGILAFRPGCFLGWHQRPWSGEEK